jgi:hypothetical protein
VRWNSHSRVDQKDTTDAPNKQSIDQPFHSVSSLSVSPPYTTLFVWRVPRLLLARSTALHRVGYSSDVLDEKEISSSLLEDEVFASRRIPDTPPVRRRPLQSGLVSHQSRPKMRTWSLSPPALLHPPGHAKVPVARHVLVPLLHVRLWEEWMALQDLDSYLETASLHQWECRSCRARSTGVRGYFRCNGASVPPHVHPRPCSHTAHSRGHAVPGVPV